MTQKAAAMGNWWWAVSSQQHTCLCITSPAESFGEMSSHPGDSALPEPRFGALQLLAFSKTKLTFEREEISEYWRNWGKYNRAADGDWENCVRSHSVYFEGDWGIIVLCTMFLVSCIFFNKCLYFSYYMAGYLLDRICICKVGFLDHTVVQVLNFWGTSELFSLVTIPFYISTTVPVATSWPTLISCLFDNRHSNRCEVIPYCRYDYISLMISDVEHFSGTWWPLNVFFKKIIIQLLYPFLIGFVWSVLLLSYMHSWVNFCEWYNIGFQCHLLYMIILFPKNNLLKRLSFLCWIFLASLWTLVACKCEGLLLGSVHWFFCLFLWE